MDISRKRFSAQISTAKDFIRKKVSQLHSLLDSRADELIGILDQYEDAYNRDCNKMQHDMEKLEKLRSETCTLQTKAIEGAVKSSVDRAMSDLTLAHRTKQVKLEFVLHLEEAVGSLANIEIEEVSLLASPDKHSASSKYRSMSSSDNNKSDKSSDETGTGASDLDESLEFSKIARDAAAETCRDYKFSNSRRRGVEEKKELVLKRSLSVEKTKHGSMPAKKGQVKMISIPITSVSYKNMDVIVYGVEKGEKIGQIMDGHGIAVDFTSHQLYVCDFKNNRVQVFFNSLYPSSIFGDGKFSRSKMDGPWGIDIECSRVFVTQNHGHCVRAYSSEKRSFIEQFGKKGVEEGEFMFPEGISVDSSHTVYVCDSGNCRMQVFTYDGKRYKFSFSFGEGLLSWPHDVHAKTSQIYVLNSLSPCLLEFSKDGALLSKLLNNGPGKDVNCPRFLTIDGDGHILISDYENSVISVFTKSGVLYTYLGGEGYGLGCLRCPMGIALMPGGGFVSVNGGDFPVLQIFS